MQFKRAEILQSTVHTLITSYEVETIQLPSLTVVTSTRTCCDHASLLIGCVICYARDFPENTNPIFMTFGRDIQHLYQISLLTFDLLR